MATRRAVAKTGGAHVALLRGVNVGGAKPVPMAVLASAKPLREASWAPEALRIGRTTALLACTSGLHASELAKAFDRATGKATTTRNWSTVLKLLALADEVGAEG